MINYKNRLRGFDPWSVIPIALKLWQCVMVVTCGKEKLPPNGTDVNERVTSGLRSYSLAHGPVPSDRDMLSGPALKGSTMS